MTPKRVYEIERDWRTASGHRAIVLRYSTGPSFQHRCGYVAVDRTHPLYQVHYDQPGILAPVDDSTPPCQLEELSSPVMVFEVHGSVTYSDMSTVDNPYPVLTEEPLWWFGFDAAHFDDTEEGGRSLAYMVEQCESLSRQLASCRLAAARTA